MREREAEKNERITFSHLFFLPQLFSSTPEAKAALRADLQRGHFDDLKGAAASVKPFAGRALAPGAAALPRLAVVDAAAPGAPPSDLPAAIAAARTAAGYGPRAPAFLLIGARASADAALDGWARVWKRREGDSPAPPPGPLIDVTLYDRASPILLAFPLGRRALLAGAASSAGRRGADAAIAHFGDGAALRTSLGLTNPLAGYAALVDGDGGVRWLGGGLVAEGEADQVRATAAAVAEE